MAHFKPLQGMACGHFLETQRQTWPESLSIWPAFSESFLQIWLKMWQWSLFSNSGINTWMLAHSSENSEAASVVEVLCWALEICTKVTSHCGTHSLERGTGPPKVTTEIAHEVFLWDS